MDGPFRGAGRLFRGMDSPLPGIRTRTAEQVARSVEPPVHSAEGSIPIREFISATTHLHL